MSLFSCKRHTTVKSGYGISRLVPVIPVVGALSCQAVNISGGGETYSLPSSRSYPWSSSCGIPGGIPTRTTVYQSFSSGASSGDIQTAVAACPDGQVVYLGAGTYNGLTINPGHQSTLRGAGAGLTVINGNISVGGNWLAPDAATWSNTRTIVSGYEKGSQSIELGSTPPAGIATGNMVMMTQTDDYDLVWHRDGNYAGIYNLRFLTEITGVSGTQVTLEAQIPYSYSSGLAPFCAPLARATYMFGIEGMTVNGTAPVSFTGGDRCWIKDCELTGFGNQGVLAYNCYRLEIRRCYIHDNAGFPSSDGYPILLQYGCAGYLIEDNIFRRCAQMIINGGPVGYVGYNYGTYQLRTALPLVEVSLNCNHGPHGTMGLWEGNICQRWQNDGYHGSTSHQVLFRNHIHGLSEAGYTNERRLVDLVKGSYYHSVVGNVIGDSSYTPTLYQAYLMAAHDSSYCYVLGWGEGGSADGTLYTVPWTNWTKSLPDADVEATLIRHANVDWSTGSARVVYAAGENQSLPNSLYYSSKPAFFGSLQWPPIGPDVSGYVINIPARHRWTTYVSSGQIADLFADEV